MDNRRLKNLIGSIPWPGETIDARLRDPAFQFEDHRRRHNEIAKARVGGDEECLRSRAADAQKAEKADEEGFQDTMKEGGFRGDREKGGLRMEDRRSANAEVTRYPPSSVLYPDCVS